MRPSNCTLVCGVVDGIKRPDGGRRVNKEAGQQGSRQGPQETRDKILQNEKEKERAFSREHNKGRGTPQSNIG